MPTRLQKSPAIVQLAGEIDVSRAPEIRALLISEIEAGHARLVLDMAAVTFLDASGIGAITAAAARARRAGGLVTIGRRSRPVERITDILFLAGSLPAELVREG